MLKSIKRFAEICSQTLPVLEPIYEFGALQVEGQEGFADLRSFFPGKSYIGTDFRKGPGVDVTIDLHDIDLPPETVGTALLLETIEHVEYPRKAIENIYHVLKNDGILIVSSLMNFPIHNHPYDYWRFTPEGFKSLFKIFDFSYVDFIGEPDFPRSVLGIASKKQIPDACMNNFKKIFDQQKIRWKNVDAAIREKNIKFDHI